MINRVINSSPWTTQWGLARLGTNLLNKYTFYLFIEYTLPGLHARNTALFDLITIPYNPDLRHSRYVKIVAQLVLITSKF